MKKIFKQYDIEFNDDTFCIYVNNLKWFEFPVSSAIDTQSADDDFAAINHTIAEAEDSITVRYFTSSNLWEEKIYTITANEDGFHYTIKVKGYGKINKIRYFTNSRAKVFYETAGYLLPKAEHKTHSNCIYDVYKENTIDSWYFSPPPFVFPFFVEGADGWFGLGLTAKPGEYNFDVFNFKVPFGLELPLYNRTEVCGEKELQGIWGGYGETDIAVIKNYSEWHYNTELCNKRDFSDSPKWWRNPIFCGWGEQQGLAAKVRTAPNAPNVVSSTMATQENYEKMIQTLDENSLPYGTIIIDAKWQERYGNPVVDKVKWPDMRGFVDKMHAKGKKVLLWIKSWDPEGLNREEGVQLLCNLIAADPTNPSYRDRVKNDIRHMLSDEKDCLNCDGFKIDFINCFPKGENIETHQRGIYGVELMKSWLSLVYKNAKSIKSDALINASCAHPYMADVIDQMRLHDYDDHMRSARSILGYRAEIVNAVYPGISIDCDAGGIESYRDFQRYIEYQPQIGVPDLYYLSRKDGTPFSSEDFNYIRGIWNKYMKEI